MDEPVCVECTQFLSQDFPHKCFNHAVCIENNFWRPSGCPNCLEIFRSADNSGKDGLKEEAMSWLQSFADELRPLCSKGKSKGDCIIDKSDLLLFGRPWLSKHIFLLGDEISAEESVANDFEEAVVNSAGPGVSEAAEQGFQLARGNMDLGVSEQVEIASSTPGFQEVPKEEVFRHNLDEAKARHLGLIVSGSNYLFPSGKYTFADSNLSNNAVLGNTVASPSRGKPISHVMAAASSQEVSSDLAKIACSPPLASGSLQKPCSPPNLEGSTPIKDLQSLVSQSVNEAMRKFMENFSFMMPSGSRPSNPVSSCQASQISSLLPGPSNQASPCAVQALGSSCQDSVSSGLAVSAMVGGGSSVLPSSITARGIPSDTLGLCTQSSQTPNPVPSISKPSPQAGFLVPSSLGHSDNVPILEDNANGDDINSSDQVLECLELPLDSPHWPGLIALTEVDDDMRAFLNQEKAPQIYSFQTKDVFVSRFGLVLHDEEYYHYEVFVGKKDGKLYAIPRLTPGEDGRLGFLISNLNAVHLFPKEKVLDGTKLRNLLSMFSNFADKDLNPVSYSCPETGKFVLDFKDSLDLSCLAKDPPKTLPIKGFACSSSVEGDQKILDFLSASLSSSSHQLKDENGVEIQQGATSPLSKDTLNKDQSLRADASLAIQALGAISELDKALGTLPDLFPERLGLLSGLKGLSHLALTSLRPVVHRSLTIVQEQRKFMRAKALNITEPDIRSSLVERDPWAPSLFPSDASQSVSDSKKVPALRQLNIKSNPSKASNNLAHHKANPAMLGKLLKAKRSQHNVNFLRKLANRSFKGTQGSQYQNFSLPPAYKANSQGSSQGVVRPRESFIPDSLKSFQAGDQEGSPSRKFFRGGRGGRGRGSFRGTVRDSSKATKGNPRQ